MGDGAQMTQAAIREGQRAAVVMMLQTAWRQLRPPFSAAPACLNAVAQMHTRTVYIYSYVMHEYKMSRNTKNVFS